jgi:WD40 repeat protein/serine/threonine protein kinase
MSSRADRNLLIGVLALQMDFIGRGQLIAAMNAWVLDKQTSLGHVLLRIKALREDEHELLEALVDKHLAKHADDPEKSLAAVSSIGSLRDELSQIADSEVEASLAHVSRDRQNEDPHATVSVGTPTSSGLRFRILRPHAKGGLGEVFVAEDEELHRQVALKHIQPHLADRSDSRARFMLEAEITGGLEHPGIVPVYGLGTYADGRPFYAMRFIRGDSMKDSIDRFHSADFAKASPGERTLQFRKLLGRFIDVCNAIDYAHSRGVLHRDLKPGNIMLGKYGETLVVDWGLAKAVGRTETAKLESEEQSLQPSSGSGSARTQMGAAIGTPHFMSPEQAAGRLDRLGSPSDVYSLGATLYSLLTGHSPFSEYPHDDIGALLRRVQFGEFSSPRQLRTRLSKGATISTQGSRPATADFDIPKPLESICLKAMALKPSDRYSSPRALADDIEHWLADEPISAWPEGLASRLGRFSRRHRAWVQTSAASLALIAIGLVVAVLSINAARDDAVAAKEKAGVERDRAGRKQYFALITLAQQAWESGNVAQCLELLKRLTPQAGEPDLRGFEYYYLYNLCGQRHQSGLTLTAHTDSVMSIARSADGRKLLSGGADGKLIVWDPVAGKLVRTLKERLHPEPGKGRDKEVRGVRAVTMTSDGRRAASATLDRIQIWDVGSGDELDRVDKIDGDCFGLSFSPDEDHLAAQVLVKTELGLLLPTILWYSMTKKECKYFDAIPELLVPGQTISALAFSPDGSTLAIATGLPVGRQVVRFLDTKDGKERTSDRLSGHRAVILALAFSRNGLLATGSADQEIRIWNLKDTIAAPAPALIGHHGFVTAVRFSTDSKKCFSAGADQTVREWDLTESRLAATYRGHADLVTSLLLSPADDTLSTAGDTVITASGDRTIRIWPHDPTSYQLLNLASDQSKQKSVDPFAALFAGKPYLVSSLSLAPDRSRLAAVVTGPDGNGTVELRSISDPKNDRPLVDDEKPGRTYACCAWSPDPDAMFVAAGEGDFLKTFELAAQGLPAPKQNSDVVVWHSGSRKVVERMQGHKYEIFSLAFSSSGKLLATGDIGGVVNIWRIGTDGRQRPQSLFKGDGQPVVDVGFSRDERFVAAAFAFNHFVKIWEVSSGQQVASLTSSFPTAVAFSPDGEGLAVGSGSFLADRATAHGEVGFWFWRKGQRLTDTFKGHTQFIRRIFYSADGTRLWSVGFDGVTRLWDIKSGNEFLKLEGKFHYALSADVSRDGKCIAVGTETGQAVLWTAEEQAITSLKGP